MKLSLAVSNRSLVLSRAVLTAAVLSLGAALGLPVPGQAHGPVHRKVETQQGQARLFTADAASGEVVAVDLPDAARIVRLTTPPFIMAMALSSDRRHLFVMRGRDTDRDWVSVIDTGFDPATGEVRPPYLARTLLAHAPTTGGRHDGMISTLGGKDTLYMDETAEIAIFQTTDFSGYGGIEVRRIKLAGPDHYHAMEVGDHIYVGHLRKGFVQVLNRDSGDEVARISGCLGLHGMAFDEESGRILFGCRSNVLVVGTRGDEAHREAGRIAYPEDQRVASFVHGKGRVLWGYTEGTLPLLYRLDLGQDPYTFETLPVPSSLQQNTTEGGEFLLVLTRGGVLEIRDGGSGALLHEVTVTKPFAKDFHEHTDKAVLPDIVSHDGRAYVSLPREGRIAVVDLAAGEVKRHLEVGGEPTRLVLLPWPQTGP